MSSTASRISSSSARPEARKIYVRGPIVFASDFGPATEWVGVCHAVIATIAPEAQVIDLTHSLPQFEAGLAGFVLRDAMPYAPICVAALVVDPGVGTSRRALAVQTGRGDILIGPDNGLLLLSAERIGGVAAAKSITTSLRLDLSGATTFHARDLFCPVAARLTVDLQFAAVGEDIDPQSLVRAPSPFLAVSKGRVACDVIDVDGFGNLRLSARAQALVDSAIDPVDIVWVQSASGEVAAHRAKAFGALTTGTLGLIVDSFGWLCLTLNRGDAAKKLGANRGSRIELRAGPA